MQHFCPRCSSGNVDRVPREHFHDLMNRITGWHVYRCRDCGTLFEDLSSAHMCPECLSGDVDRVHRKNFGDHIKGVFGWRVYRCRECGARFYDRPINKAS